MFKIKSLIIITIILLIGLNAFTDERDFSKYSTYLEEAKTALHAKDVNKAIEAYQKISELTPGNPRVIYYIGYLYAAGGDTDNSIKYITRALEMGYSQFNLEIPVFAGLKQHTGWKNIEGLYKKLKTPVNNSKPAFTITERDLTPECIVYNPVTESFYLGSMWKHKIVRIDKNYQASDFTSPGQDGLKAIAGMKIDTKNRILYALSVVTPVVPSCDLSEAGLSELYKYNLDTGKLIRKYRLYDKNSPHLFNDLVVTSEGDVYITDTDDSSIYRISHKTDELELFIKADEFIFPNGITIDDAEENIFMAASGIGIYRINIETGKYGLVLHSADITLSGVDGMYFYRNSLVCVQNNLNRIVRFYLNENGDAVTKLDIIESENPDFILPTTGTIIDGSFYYIANSQIYSVGQDRKLLPAEQLKDIIIFKAKLN